MAKGPQKNVPALPVGRPSKFTTELGTQICALIVEGIPLRAISKKLEFGLTTLFRWLEQDEEFRKQYARARELQAEVLADEIVAISDDGQNDTYEDDEGQVRTNFDVVQRSRLRVDARKWVAAKLLPKKYGEKQQVEHSGTVTLEGLVCGNE